MMSAAGEPFLKGAYWQPEVVCVLLVREPGPSRLRFVTIDCAVDETRDKLQRLVRVAADWTELSHHDAIQRVRQLLKAPVGQIPAQAQLLKQNHEACLHDTSALLKTTHFATDWMKLSQFHAAR